MPIYIAGPVLRPGTKQPGWVTSCYRAVEDVVRLNPKFQAQFPLAEPLLERMDAGSFAMELTRRITAADSVIAVLLPDDQSTPIECALAAAAGKRVLLFHDAGTRIPRILAGLPRVTTAVYDKNAPGTIARFLTAEIPGF